MVAPINIPSFTAPPEDLSASPKTKFNRLLEAFAKEFPEKESSFQQYFIERTATILSEETASAAGKIVNVFQSEVAFTNASDNKPLVGTFGCAPCVAFGGYEEANKLAFVAHISKVEEVFLTCSLLFSHISQLTEKEIREPIKLYLRGGLAGSQYPSYAIIQTIKNLVQNTNVFPMEIVSEERTLLSEFTGESLLIDSRTGDVRSYCPEDYVLYLEEPFSEEEMARVVKSCTESPQFQLIYSPVL